jgi:hypothetical protein
MLRFKCYFPTLTKINLIDISLIYFILFTKLKLNILNIFLYFIFYINKTINNYQNLNIYFNPQVLFYNLKIFVFDKINNINKSIQIIWYLILNLLV